MRIFNDFSKVLSFLMRNTRGIRHSRLLVFLVLIVGFISGVANTGLIAVVNAALNRSGSFSMALVWGFVGLCILLPLTRFISSALLAYLNTRANFEICALMSRQMLAAPLRLLEQIGPHRLLATLTSDINTIGNILPALPGVVMNLALVAGCLVYLGWLSMKLLLALLVMLCVGVVTYQLPIIRSRQYFKMLRYKGDALVSHYRAMVEGSKELKLHSRRGEAFHWQFLLPTAADMARLSYKGSVINAAAMSWGVLLSFIPIGVLIFAAPAVINVNAEILTGYILTILYMVGPLQAIMSVLPSISYAAISIDKISSLGLPLDSGAMVPASQLAQTSSWDSLELAGVTHTYHREKEEGNFTLGPIDLTFQPGEVVFLIGGNGSGKTTLAKLITGLYTPESGEIRFNEKPVTAEDRQAYRQNFSMLFSDFFLFESLLGMEAPNLDVRAQEYLRELQLENKVQVKDGKLSTTNLSQGQRKRLALLTAFLEDRPIYIFDEWASDQDPVFREVFYFRIVPDLKARGKTVIVISHDDRYFHTGDRIIKLDYGQVEYNKSTVQSQSAASGVSLPHVGV